MSTKKPTVTKVADDGLRYAKKAAGTPFGGSSGVFSGGTMSCFKCGKHRPRPELEVKKLLGKSHQVSRGGCATS